MMRVLQSILLGAALLLITNCSSNDSQDGIPQNLPPSSYNEILNVSYDDNSNQVYDIYLPENRTLETKVIILVHGGGWISGDKEDMNGFKDSILRDLPGYAVVNINYRLADENTPPHPMQVNDISTVINHLKANRNEYVISENYGLIGVSAGAHLSLLWSYAYDAENNINMVASIVGPTNLADPEYLNSTDPELQAIINLYSIDKSPSFLRQVSPYHQVTSKAPPTILFYGGQDPLVPISQGSDLDKKLTALNVVHEFNLYPEEGHGWTGLKLFDTWNKLKMFTLEHL